MSRFITELQTRKVSEPRHLFDRAKWQTITPLIYSSKVAKQVFIVPAGFVTDFASVPRICWMYALAGDTGHASATVHDFLCRSKKISRRLADSVFVEALKVEGAPGWRRLMMFLGVRIGAIFMK